MADHLATLDDVVATNWDETGVVFRLDGGLPVTAMTDAASPTEPTTASFEPGEATLDFGPIHNVSFPADGDTTRSVLAVATDDGSTYEPTRRPDIRPRTAMVLSPTREADLEATNIANAQVGNPPQPAPPTETRDALRSSDQFDVLDLPDEEADPGQWANMQAFDIVVIETHGANYECTAEREVCGLFLAGPLAAPYLADLGLTGEEAQFRDFGGFTFARISVDHEFHITFQDDFFHRNAAGGQLKTVVIVNACRMGEESVSTTALASNIAGSEGSVFSWSTALPRASSDSRTAILATFLADGADSRSAFEQMRLNGDHTAEYRAIVSELLLYQEPGVNQRTRDVVQTMVEGSLVQPGATIAAKGAPEDGEYDRIEGVALLIDAVNRGDEVTTSIKVTVDGQPLKMWQDGVEIEEVFLSDRTVDTARESKGSWQHHRVDLDQALLPFDLMEEDVTQGRGHVWEVTVQGETGGPAIHKVDPVIFRLGTVRIMNPNNSFPLTTEERVGIDGTINDGEAEIYPLIVRVEHLDEAAVPENYEVRVSFDGQEETLPLTAFENRGDGTFVYEMERSVGDLQSEETETQVSALLFRKPTSVNDEGIEVDKFDPSPIFLVVVNDGSPGEATIIVGGQTWDFELNEFLGGGCLLDGESLVAAGSVDGDPAGVSFFAELFATGAGDLTVDDATANQEWMAAADRAGMTVLHLVPVGQSQIDSISFNGRTVRGTATFIDSVAFRQAWSSNGTYPNPVVGSFEIRCPTGP